MKKIISLGIASAICAITAISASAAPAIYDSPKGEIANGEVITIDVKAGEDLKGLAFKVETEGLEVQDVKNPGSFMVNTYDKATKTFMVSGGDAVVAKAGETLCTITAKVTAAAGGEIKVSLVDNSGKYTAVLPDVAYTATVKGATTPGTSSGTTSSGTSSGTSTGTSSGTTSKPDGGDKIPGTGIALAVVPAVLAAAGVVVAKKRK